GFGFVRNSSGTFSTAGATGHDLKLMRAHTPAGMGVKAAGGIRTYADAVRVLALGATRIGTTSTAAIVGAQQSERAARDQHKVGSKEPRASPWTIGRLPA